MGWWVLIRFKDDPYTFYITSSYHFEIKSGDCVKVIGVLNRDPNGVPFMKTDQLYKCD